jgi:hypothetical protein
VGCPDSSPVVAALIFDGTNVWRGKELDGSSSGIWGLGSSTRFSTSSFFHESTLYSPRILHPKIFLNSFSNLPKYSYLKLFPGVWYPTELCSAGSDTPQHFVRRSIRPCRTFFCGVSDPAEQASYIKCTHLCHCSAGSDTQQDLVPWGLIPRRVWYPAGSCSAGSDTSQDLVLRGIRPHWQIKTPQN